MTARGQPFARAVSVDVRFMNTPRAVANELVDALSSRRNLQVKDVRLEFAAFMEGGGVSWDTIFITVQPIALATGAYVAKKTIDVIADLAKDWVQRRMAREYKRILILGPDGGVARCVEVANGEANDVTESYRNKNLSDPFKDLFKKE